MTRLGQTLLIRLAAVSLCLAPLTFADRQNNLVSVHDGNIISLIDGLIAISIGLQDRNRNAERRGQPDCPSESTFSASRYRFEKAIANGLLDQESFVAGVRLEL